MKNYKVSIITPNLNYGRYIEETIISVIKQTYYNIEYIIVDGGSTDNSKEIYEKYKSKVSKIIIQKDENMYQAIDRGFKNSSGDIIGWINADDLYFPNAIEDAVKHFEITNCDWLVGKTSKKIKEKVFTYPVPFYYPRSYIQKGRCHKMDFGCISQESVLFKKSLYIKSGGLDLNYKLAGDFLLWKKFSNFATLETINKKIGIFRVQKNQISADQKKYYKEINLNYSYRLNFYRMIYSIYKFFIQKLIK